jgi:serine/threonine-protein kinase
VSSPKICPQCGAGYELDQRFCPKDGTTLRLRNESGDLVGSIVADRYHVVRKLGEGGMGQVYLAEHVKMGRMSALKVMNPAMVKNADAISRFNREASNASRINHPNVADIYDFGETPDGIIYLAMEFVDGPPLRNLIEEAGPLPPGRAAAIVRQTADALAAAHELGIVHRDLKPDNIMVARGRDGSDLVKVVDFGIAKAADNAAQKVTRTGLIVGTPEYMSPEQLAGDTLDGRSDIYALGLVAFNMLTGRLPFPAETVQESMIMRLTEPPRTLADMRPDVGWPGDVQAALDRALERDASLRFTSASEFGAALSQALERMASVADRSTTPMPRPAPADAPDKEPAAHNSVPPTRVRRGPAPSEGALEPPRRRLPAALGAGGLVLVGVLATAMVMRRDGPKLGDTVNVTPAGRPPSDVSPPKDTAAEVSAALDSLERVLSAVDATPAQAGDALRALEQMRGRIRVNEQVVQAGVVEAFAQSIRHHQAAACAALRRVESAARTTRRARVVQNTIAITCS